LISVLSAARPKIANYPFTTLTPNLGVVEMGPEESFVIADIPGLIEGAHAGAGLGIQFLRHVERTRLLAQVVDVSEYSGREPESDVAVIQEELRQFGGGLERKPMLLVASKLDIASPAKLEALRGLSQRLGVPMYPVSAVTGEGVAKLKHALAARLREVRSAEAAAASAAPPDAVA
ncbi:MAG: Obg family GTPase, partial [Terriglobales bacterium]